MGMENKNKILPVKTRWWNNSQNRALLFQVILLLFVTAVFFYIGKNTLHNLEQRGISTGFSFLQEKAGFGIGQTLISYSEESTYWRTFLVGLTNTLLVSFLGIIFATALGFIIGVARLSSNWLISRLAALYIETFRNVPLLLQIFFWYFAVLRALPSPRQSYSLGEYVYLNIRGLVMPRPVFEDGFSLVVWAFAISLVAVIFLWRWAKKRQEETGQTFPALPVSLAVLFAVPALVYFALGQPLHFDMPVLKGFNFRGGITIIPELVALVTALSIYTASFIAEIVRSGIMSVSHGQTEAAYALGLKPARTMQLVIIPQSMRVIIPQLTSQYLNLIKNSSLATAIGYPDLVSVFAGTTLNQSGQAIEIIAMTMLVYLSISLLVSFFMNWYNNKAMLRER